MDMGLSEEEICRPASVAEHRRHPDQTSQEIQVLLRRQHNNRERVYKGTSLCQSRQEKPIAIYDKGSHF